MVTPPRLRKFGLFAHIVASVGWLGAVLASLALAVVGLTSADGYLAQAACLVMRSLGWAILVPLSILSLATGVVQALGTRWGLLRHYWVIVKLVMNIFATVVLLLYMQTLTNLEATARGWADGEPLRTSSPALHSAAALVLLLVAAIVSVYKPKGQTRYGQRRAAA